MMLLFWVACTHNPEKEIETSADVTYYQDIAPLLHQHCSGCHSASGLNPVLIFSDYQAVSQLAPLIYSAIQDDRMPPFMAQESEECPNDWGWSHDPRLSAEEKSLMQAWIDAGMPEGDSDNPAPLIDPQSQHLSDAMVLMPLGGYTTEPVGLTKDEFVCYSIDPNIDEAAWLEAFEVLPGNAAVVHHVLVGIDNDGQSASMVDENGLYPCFGGFGLSNTTFIGGWIPGSSPTVMPKHSAVRVPAESRLVLQMHYHLVEDAQFDTTGLAVQWAERPPVRQAFFSLIGNSFSADNGLVTTSQDQGFMIPAGAQAHTETMHYEVFENLSRGIEIFMVANHMHYIGERMRMWVEGAEDICLLDTPRWDFDWQQSYFYDADNNNAPIIQPGSELWLECTYNNSLSNPDLVQALQESDLEDPINVTLGEGSLDEMCLGVFGMVPELTYKHPTPTHSGDVTLNIGGLLGLECLGIASMKHTAEGTELNGACGVVVQDNLISVELEIQAGVLTLKVPLVDETPQELSWELAEEGDETVISVSGTITVNQNNLNILGTFRLQPE